MNIFYLFGLLGILFFIPLTVFAMNIPDPISDLNAVHGNMEMTLSWSEPFNGGDTISDYIIEYREDGVTWITYADGIDTATTTIVTGLINGQPYDFRVSAVNVNGVGPSSNVVTEAPSTVPTVPTNLVAVAGDMQILLVWIAPNDNGGSDITHYNIEYSVDGQNWSTFIHNPSPDTSAIVDNLTNGQEYQFRVSAVNVNGVSQPSDVATQTPMSLPGPPENLSSNSCNDNIFLSWNAPTDNGGVPVYDYQIEYAINGTPWIIFNDGVSSATTSIPITGLTNGQPYDFRVSAINVVGASILSAIISETPSDSMSCLNPGDILVIDKDGGTSSQGALFAINPTDGQRTLLSDFGILSEGPLGIDPVDVDVNSLNQVVVLDSQLKLVFSYDDSTGTRSVVSDFTNALQGEIGNLPQGLSISDTSIFVSDDSGGIDFDSVIWDVDYISGNRNILSNFSLFSQGVIATQGPALSDIDPVGNILTLVYGELFDFRGVVVTVDSNDGQRMVLSDFSDSSQGIVGFPGAITVDDFGNIHVTSIDPEVVGGAPTLYHIDSSGFRTLVSDFSDSSQGDVGVGMIGDIQADSLGNVLVIFDNNSDPGYVLKVDTTTGTRTILSSFDLSSQGPLGSNPVGITIVPNTDLDSDGIQNIIDDDPTGPSTTFSDVSIGGTTSGTITSSGDQTLTVTEINNPTGVRITVSSSSGSESALVVACGGLSSYTLSPGSDIVVTCSSVHTKVIQGSVEVNFSTSGVTADAIISSGNALFFDDNTLQFTGDSDNSNNIVIEIGDDIYTVSPGQTVDVSSIDESDGLPIYVLILVILFIIAVIAIIIYLIFRYR